MVKRTVSRSSRGQPCPAARPSSSARAAGKLLELDFELKLPQNQALGEKLVQYMSREEGLGL